MSSAPSQDGRISLPQGGGALSGIGEKFSPDLHTGTGNFTVPIELPSGRNSLQPSLSLVYSTGNENSSFGLSWNLGIPDISRKTSSGVPLYNETNQQLTNTEKRDTFILSGAEDLIPVSGNYPDNVTYRPRTEGLFARITHHRQTSSNYWQVESKDGLTSIYGSSNSSNNTAILTKPDNPQHIFSWKLTETIDTFGNRIKYEYEQGTEEADNQLLLKRIRYVDYGDPADDQFLVHVDFIYEERPDPFSNYRAGFEIRNNRRCKSILVSTHTEDGTKYLVREYRFTYIEETHNGASLFHQLDIIGFDDEGNAYEADDSSATYPKQLPPLTFSYSKFEPENRQFKIVEGNDLPFKDLSAPDIELVDLHGSGLPDILEMNNTTVRYWRNLGNGQFDMARPMSEAPPHSLADSGVQMLDANGNGQLDLLVNTSTQSGYYPLEHGAKWSRRSFQRYRTSPSFDFTDPEIKRVDMNGDGYTDILRSSSRLECYFNNPDPSLAWTQTHFATRQSLDTFPNVNFSDPRVRLADMTGDGLQDIVLIHDGNIEYWPNLGHNRWGKRVSMRYAPRYHESGYPIGYDPQRLLLGDIDGDGVADLIYVGNDKVTLWINQNGNSWSQEPITINGTPPVNNRSQVRLVDLYGTGVSGVLWSTNSTVTSRSRMMFLDFTGDSKPYLLNKMDNHMGSTTHVEYKPSTYYFLKDQKKLKTQWRSPLPFPVQVVSKVKVVDAISQGKLTTEYRYHHGYWDGVEREFRGFGMVEQLDTERFTDYHQSSEGFKAVEEQRFSPPILTKTWFHQGPVGEEFGDWEELDYTHEYWDGDPQLLEHTEQVNSFLANYNDRSENTASSNNRRIKRDALRTLRGSILRSELYALDGSKRESQPYTVTEQSYKLAEIDAPIESNNRKHIFFSYGFAQRTTQWERGEDPMTQFSLTHYQNINGELDSYGRPYSQTAIAMPRLAKHQRTITAAIVGTIKVDESQVLATQSRTQYAKPIDNTSYIHDRVSQTHAYELLDPPSAPDLITDSLQTALRKQWQEAKRVHNLFNDLSQINVIAHQLNHYDGNEFIGLDIGLLDTHGVLSRNETLVYQDELLNTAYGDRRPAYLEGAATLPNNAPSNFGKNSGYRKETGVNSHYETGYYTETTRQKGSEKGLPLVILDALGHKTSLTYDAYHLLPLKVTDATGLETTATYNYRLLQPETMTGENGNTTHLKYNPIGSPQQQFISGTDASGNLIGGTEAKPDSTFQYNFLNFEHHKKPIFVHSKQRIYHASDNISDDSIESREYSDGFGRLIQSRAQAEDHVLGELGDQVGLQLNNVTDAIEQYIDDSVVVSGWDLFDNKGQVIEKYEPFFSQGWGFQREADAKKGHHASMFYDSRGQVIRTLNPDASQQRVVFGYPLDSNQLALSAIDLESSELPENFSPSPWESYSYDPNDLANLTHSNGSNTNNTHHNTPSSVITDAMGRALCSIVRNGQLPESDWYLSQSSYDIRNNLIKITDTLGRTAFNYYYDLLNRSLAVDSIDAGKRTSVLDALGNLIEYRDSKGSLALRTYDELNRPKEIWASNNDTNAFTLRESIHYGDEGNRIEALKKNTLGKPIQHFDEAGVLKMPSYDFKGNLLEKSRRTIRDNAIAQGWQADWSQPNADDKIEDEPYQTSIHYDALNRPIEITYPEDIISQRKKLTPSYNRAGALVSVQLDNDNYIRHIAYNAKGQRTLVAHGNGLMTRYAYEEETFRLIRLRTDNFTLNQNTTQQTRTWQSNTQALQDFRYQYDLVGNITQIDEQTKNCGITNSQEGRDKLLREFDYDPIYRLLSATGRACNNIGSPRSTADSSRCGFYSGSPATFNQHNTPDQTEQYREIFDYDPAGNMLSMAYQAASGNWKRDYGIDGLPNNQWENAENNRLTSLSTGINTPTQQYTYDANGNLLNQNTSKYHVWDYADRMIGYRVQTSSSSPASIEAHYLYGADGMRVKKWVRNQQGHINTSTYIDSVFEQHTVKTNTLDKANNTLHIMDGENRLALIRVGDPLDEKEVSPQIQLQFSDHLGSSHITVGGDTHTANTFINREEYFPYGETSLGSFGKKSYRYSGKERDEESGLFYYGARYLLLGLVRWVSTDPIGPEDNINLYTFLRGNPLNNIDPNGLKSTPPEPKVHFVREGNSKKYSSLEEAVGSNIVNTENGVFTQEELDKEQSIDYGEIKEIVGVNNEKSRVNYSDAGRDCRKAVDMTAQKTGYKDESIEKGDIRRETVSHYTKKQKQKMIASINNPILTSRKRNKIGIRRIIESISTGGPAWIAVAESKTAGKSENGGVAAHWVMINKMEFGVDFRSTEKTILSFGALENADNDNRKTVSFDVSFKRIHKPKEKSTVFSYSKTDYTIVLSSTPLKDTYSSPKNMTNFNMKIK